MTAFMNQRKVCAFCETNTKKIDYKDTKILKKYLTEQGKIIPGFVTGICSKHQRHLTKAIKRARNIALLAPSVDMMDY